MVGRSIVSKMLKNHNFFLQNMDEPIIICNKPTTPRQLAANIKGGSDLMAYLAVVVTFPKGATNKNFEERIHLHLPPGRQSHWIPGGGKSQHYAMGVRNMPGMGLLVTRDFWPHKYKLTYVGLMVCAELFGIHQQVFNVDPLHEETDVVQRLLKMIDEHDDNPEQCLIVNTELDLTNED